MRKLLIIGLVWPEPRSSAAGWRMLQLVNLFSKQYEVHFASAANKSLYAQDLSSLAVMEHAILLNDHSFDNFIQELCPEIVVFDRFMSEEQYGWRVAQHCPNALRILDTEDLHFLRIARQEAYLKDKPLLLHSDTAKREIAAIYRSDINLLISKTEQTLLEEQFAVPKSILYYLPFIEKPITALTKLTWQTFEARTNFVFIGNFIHEPNWRTVEILKKNVWPMIRKSLPQAEMHIYGAYASDKVLQLNKPAEKFFIKGRAHDARATVQQYRVLLAPIPFGAGVKGKFVDAMQSGTPSVTTTVGAEAMGNSSNWNGFIVDDVAEFANKAVQLYSDADTWYKCQEKGTNLLNTMYAGQRLPSKFLIDIEQVLATLEAHRKSNFMGQILQQQQLQASKYMALWIESKNKKANL